MARGGSRSGGGIRPSPSRSPSPMASRPPPVMRQSGPQGPSMMGNVASTAGGVALGSVMGHGLSRMLYGSPAAAAAGPDAPERAPEPSEQSAAESLAQAQRQNPCFFQDTQFQQCLTQVVRITSLFFRTTMNSLRSPQSKIEACQFPFDAMVACRKQYGLM